MIFWARLRMSSVGNYCEREGCLKRLEALLREMHGGSPRVAPRSLQYFGPIEVGGAVAAPSLRTLLVEHSRRGTFNATFNVSVGLFALLW